MDHAGVEVHTLPNAAKQELLYGTIYRRYAVAVQVLIRLGADPCCKDPMGIREKPIHVSTKERCIGGKEGDVTSHADLLAAMGLRRASVKVACLTACAFAGAWAAAVHRIRSSCNIQQHPRQICVDFQNSSLYILYLTNF